MPARRGARGRGASSALIAVAIAVYQLAFFAAVDRTGVAVGTVVALGSAPALAGVAGRLLDGEPLTRRWAHATALACAGVLLLVLGGGGASVDPLGIMLAVVVGRRLRHVHDPRQAAAAARPRARARDGGVVLARRVLLAPVLLARRPRAGSPTATGSLMALFLGAVPTALAYVLFARGLRRLTPGETATLTLAEPLTATGPRDPRARRAARRGRGRPAPGSSSPGCSRSPLPERLRRSGPRRPAPAASAAGA